MVTRMGSIAMGRTSYMNAPQRDTLSQANTWASHIHSATV